MEVFLQKKLKIPGTHKIGAAFLGSGIAGGKITDVKYCLMYGMEDSHNAGNRGEMAQPDSGKNFKTWSGHRENGELLRKLRTS